MLSVLSVFIKILGGATVIAISGILFYFFALGVHDKKVAILLFFAFILLVLGLALVARGLKEYLSLD